MMLRLRNICLSLLVVSVTFSCNNKKQSQLNEGVWLAELTAMDEAVLPFNFEVILTDQDTYELKIFNADEVITVDEIEINNDSIHIKFPVYEGYIKGVYTANSIEGEFIKESLDRIVPFKAIYGIKDRFQNSSSALVDITGVWETTFEPNSDDIYIGKGIFKAIGDQVVGTFRTTTGDYRYLEGVMSGDSLKVSAFDGAHAFVFNAKVNDSSMNGAFYSGNHSKELFVAKRNETFELPSADSLTFLKPGYDEFSFSFPNEKGEIISLKDDSFKNKLVVVQIMGSWCPNCLDETKYYVEYMKKNPEANMEFVGLAFEYAKTEEKALQSIARLKERIGVEYPILLAQYGSSNKELAQQKLPMLNHVLSYPTSIFIDKQGEVRKIHTGFNGPATGEKFIKFQSEFDSFVKRLLSE